MSYKTNEKKFQNCWEYMDCSIDKRKKCDAYKKNLGGACWFVANKFGTESQSYKEFNGCKNCPWYKIQNS